MKKLYKKISLILVLIFIFNLSVFAEGKKEVKILFTHDLHDRIEEYKVYENNEIKTIGGFERLASLIERERNSHTVLVDSGDYSMGTLYQTIFTSEAPSLRLLGKLGYDAITLGNHEFDFGAEGLAQHLNIAREKSDNLPQIVFSNIDFSQKENLNEEGVEALKESFSNYGVEDYIVIEKAGVKIGIFGILGEEAISNAPLAGVAFKDPLERAKDISKILKEEENVDLVIALSHSGTDEEAEKSEDEILAKEAPYIDVIVSGHTHTTLTSPIVVNDAYIVSAGRYGENLGVLDLVKEGDSWELKDYSLESSDIDISNKNFLTEDIKYFREKIQKTYLGRFNLEYDQILARSDFNFTPAKLTGNFHGEDRLGNFIADAFKYTVEDIEGEGQAPIAAAIVPAGMIRDSFVKGDIYVPDVFNSHSLGIGPDQVSGYPLVDAYLTGEDLRRVAEVDASVAPIRSIAQLYSSGLNYSFNPNRLIFNKLTDIYLDQDGERVEIEDDKLYRVVAGLFTGEMLSMVEDQSYGLLPIVPRDEKGDPIKDFTDRIIYKDGLEVKEWYAIANYMSSFEKEDGYPKIPRKYNELEGRKIIDNNKGLASFFKAPNKFAKIVYLISTFLILVLLLLIYFLYRKTRLRKKED